MPTTPPQDMTRYDHVFFVCTHQRAADSAKDSCSKKGGEALLARLKKRIAQAGLKDKVRATRAGCLDLCAHGCAMAVFCRDARVGPSQQVWYGSLAPVDADAVFEAHVTHGTTLAAKTLHFANDHATPV